MSKIIKHQFFFAHPAEMVWEYLTNADLMAQWIMKNDFQPIVGFDFQFRTGPMPALDFDGIIYCKVLEVVPFEKLSYSWKSGPGDGVITLDSVVIWKLEPKENGTEVFLEHSGFSDTVNLDLYNAMNGGWAQKLPAINNLLSAAQHGHTNA
ncbi:SRPBCC family protein [Mucilaginibacter celer]|uniref:SRPBCC domain-containing protein n=1 Tax=Mucilaginibacter celer TaxID=2305508 RepID=A0A494VKL3_9SPHI|nr:SRPBCC domain-containing protein [Mucilaginibacter celer]AYL95707.1 SRPBCC domain-containing protein [Mucilaginibacter celer]